MAKTLPKKGVLMRASLFGDGARGMRLQMYENEEYLVYCCATLANRDAEWERTWTSDVTGEIQYDTFAALRTAYNALLKN